MIHSMTAYARKEFKGDWGTAVWEIRSVNQRYLETYIRLPEQFRGLEAVLRERFRKKLQRGKVECNLRFEASAANSGALQLNEALAEKLIESANWVSKKAGKAKLNPVDILRWPGVMEAAEKDMGELSTDLLSFFNETLGEFLESRASEGEKLQAMLEQRLAGITEQADFVQGKMPEIIEWQRERIQKKFTDAKIELDETRVEQELILMAQKLDVAEEIDRLNAHVTETHSILKKGGACGRRLDFMMQEFNRESNTLGSKSISTDITKSAVELKVLIEQMREQLQNIE
ncbi:YicC/YloC family endoribonuclease [Moritella sp. 28]|uniref:YicC/YloC family endoribonuclease n=1 Tax=Moritella sp. 28 TaxID=2746232 RepID=UPI001BA7A5CA|nr:YicC/YloC family endoribonuclease [Moritella sp. 28]QUM86940.1 YicC family protein [Moritella sp. 28]